MKFLRKFGVVRRYIDDLPDFAEESSSMLNQESHLLRTIGWISAGAGALVLGLVVGRELRQRYKFNRRTPYDFYAHSGDNIPDVDFGLGV